MRMIRALLLAAIASCAHRPPSTLDDVSAVSPALARYTTELVRGELWRRAELSMRDRSLATVSALVARRDQVELPHYLELALDRGVTPAELSEVITHLAFYTGWGSAMSAAPIARRVFDKRGVRRDQLPAASPPLLPLDEAAEARRAELVGNNLGATAPGVVDYTTRVLFRELWQRPGLAPRDRSLVTVSALIATGQAAQLPFHLNRAMDNGLTRADAAEVLTQLAFVAGWPSVFSSLPVVKDVMEKRDQ